MLIRTHKYMSRHALIEYVLLRKEKIAYNIFNTEKLLHDRRIFVSLK